MIMIMMISIALYRYMRIGAYPSLVICVHVSIASLFRYGSQKVSVRADVLALARLQVHPLVRATTRGANIYALLQYTILAK